jgi:murein tripeptide amidase MpaA
MDHYLNEAELLSAMQALAAAYPDDCELVTLPHTTHETRSVYALHIVSKLQPSVLEGPKVGVLFTGSVHAREWGGADILVYLASDLLKAYAAGQGLVYSVAGKGPGVTFTAAEIQTLRRRLDLYLIPCVNPDGRAYSMSTDSLWRKNRNPASSGGIASNIGVDVNRNFDFLWNYKQAFAPSAQSIFSMASDNPGSDTFFGTGPSSEPETKNVAYVMSTFSQIAYFVDVHSYTGDVLYSWGDAPNQSSKLAQNFSNHTFDGKRGVDDLSVYGEHIASDTEATAKALGKVITDTIHDVTGEDYATTQGFYLAPGSPGGSAGATYPTGGTSDDFATSRSSAEPGRPPLLGFTIEFHRYGGSDYDFAFHPPFPEMANIIAEIDAGLIAFCLSSVAMSGSKLKLPEIVAEVLFGVTEDGGGVVIVNGKPHRIPPWDPLIPELSQALRVYIDAGALPAKRAREARGVALDAMADAIKAAGKIRAP